MITLKGAGKHPGLAIAVAAVVDFTEGPSSLPYSILQRAAEALKRQVLPSDQPEIIIVCKQLIFGVTLNIPGLQKAALVAESPDDAPGVPIEIPCVVGVSGAMKDIKSEMIVIVDGYRGVVIVDPDARTLADYQNEVEDRRQKARVFLESAHLPAKTQDGRHITVAARVRCLADLRDAVTHGADSITAEVALADPECEEFISAVMAAAGGKPVTIIPDDVVAPFLQFILRLSLPGQITIAFLGDAIIRQKAHLAETIRIIEENEPGESLPRPETAVVARSASEAYAAKSAGVSVILERSPDELEGAVRKWVSECDADRLTVALGGSLDLLPSVVEAGARTVEVTPALVEEAKNLIRQLPATT